MEQGQHIASARAGPPRPGSDKRAYRSEGNLGSSSNRHIPCLPPSRRRAPMKVTVQLIVYDADGHEETVTEVVVLEKPCQQIEHVGVDSNRRENPLDGASAAHCGAIGQLISGHGEQLPSVWYPAPHERRKSIVPSTSEPSSASSNCRAHDSAAVRFTRRPQLPSILCPPSCPSARPRSPLHGNEVSVIGIV
jgi:hypothetical protein